MAGKDEMKFDLVAGWLHFPEGYSPHNVTGVAIDEGDRVFVLTRDDPRVIVYQRNGELVRMWGEGLESALDVNPTEFGERLLTRRFHHLDFGAVG